MVTLSSPPSPSNTTQVVSAGTINRHLAGGGMVQVTTSTRSTIYNSRHVGWFSMRSGSLYVRYGRHHNCLSIGDRLLVGIRFGRLET